MEVTLLSLMGQAELQAALRHTQKPPSVIKIPKVNTYLNTQSFDMDFDNAAGFIGVKSQVTEAQYVVYFLSHAMLFCTGALVEAHVVLTTASCVFGERYKFDVFGGTHKFLEYSGISRQVEHMCIHRGYNHSMRWETCSAENLALLLLSEQFFLHAREPDTEFIMNRVRYGALAYQASNVNSDCKFFGWGSRRNGYLIPLLIHLRRVDVVILPSNNCQKMWNYEDKYLCLQQFSCKDDLGSVIECSGFLRGMMTSRLIDRPCGVGFLDMTKFLKFLTCGVDDSRDILGHNDFMAFEFDESTAKNHKMPFVIPVSQPTNYSKSIDQGFDEDPNDPGPPKMAAALGEEALEQEDEKIVKPKHVDVDGTL